VESLKFPDLFTNGIRDFERPFRYVRSFQQDVENQESKHRKSENIFKKRNLKGQTMVLLDVFCDISKVLET